MKTPERLKGKISPQLQPKVRASSQKKFFFVQLKSIKFARRSEHVRRASLRLSASSLRFRILFVLQEAKEFKRIFRWLISFTLHISLLSKVYSSARNLTLNQNKI